MSDGTGSDGAARNDLIELRGVSMRFRTQSVLRALNLTIHRGETVCIIGESGCGKTVLLKLIIGLLHATEGTVWFDGQDVAHLGGKDLIKLRLRFGFLFQMAALFDSLTVYDNVAFGLREHHLCNEEKIRTIVSDRLQEVGLPAGLERKKPAELSGGQRKRVGLARALALNPEVMLYDEPTTGLDPIMSDVINELILQTQQTKKTTGVVVTHDMKTVTKVADRVVMLYPLARLEAGRAPDHLRRPPRGHGPRSRPARPPVRPRRGRRAAPRDGPGAGQQHTESIHPWNHPASDTKRSDEVDMNERVMQFRIGMFVIVAGLVLTMLIVWFGESPSLLRDQIYLKARYAEAPGVLEGVAVRKSGIRVGEVVAIAFDDRPNQPDGVLVTMAIERSTRSARARSRG